MADKLFRKGTFTFIGNVVTGKELVTTQKMGTSDWKKTRLNLGIKNDNNLQFLTMEYIHSDKVKTTKFFNTEGEAFDVKWEDTMKPSTLNKISEMNRIVVDLETDFEIKKEYTKLIFKKHNHEFKEEKTDEDLEKIKEYDAQIKELAVNRVEFAHVKDTIKFLEASISMIKDKKLKVTGTIKSNYYDGKNVLQYIPSRIEIVEDDTESQLKAFIDVFYDKDGVQDDEKAKKINVFGYIGERIKKQDKLFPIVATIDYTRIDLENEQHMLLLNFMKNTFKITDKKQVHKIGVEINIINGAEMVEFDETCLTPDQKMGIELGFNTIDDFKPKGNVYGSKIEELRVCKADLKTYPNGSVEVFATSNLIDFLALDDSDKKEEDVKTDKPQENTKEDSKQDSKQQSTEDLMKSLFS